MNHPCGYCDNRYPSLAELVHHVKEDHGPGLQIWYCQPCDQSFTSHRELIEHEEKVHGIQR